MSRCSSHYTALGLGSNLGDRESQLHKAIESLRENGFKIHRSSSFYDTAPVDCVPGTPRFLNAAVIGQWSSTPYALLRLCKKIEVEMGRPEIHSSAEARVIDIDILLFGTQVIRRKELLVPHPRLAERRFILEPLNEIAPDWHIPPGHMTVAEALAKGDG